MRNTDKRIYEKLFGISRDAVVVLRKKKVIYMNSRAQGLFPGEKVLEMIPEFLLTFDGEQFSATAEIAGEKHSVAVSKTDGDTIFTVFPETHGDELKKFDSFLGNVSQELRSAMSVISMSSELLHDGSKLNDEKAEMYAAILTHNAYIAKRVMNNIDMLRVLNGKSWEKKTQCFDLVTLIGELIDSVNTVIDKGDMRIAFRHTMCEKSFFGDRDKIELVLLNLLSNSLKYTSGGDSITVELTEKGDYSLIKVSDTGSGIRPSRLVSSFESFMSQRELSDTGAGSGVGLAIVDHIAHMHNGFTLLESPSGKGTTVTVLLRSDKTGNFKDSTVSYGAGSMDSILTELSDILSYKAYMKKYLD